MEDLLKEIKEYGLASMTHSGHPKSHIYRIETLVKKYFIGKKGVDDLVLLTAVYLHDIARALEKRMKREGKNCCHADAGAELAHEYLHYIDFPEDKIPLVVHAIETHRYSKAKKPKTIEARILQECDKLDAMGAIGIIRTLISYPSGENTAFYHQKDPLAKNRELDDNKYGVDHFFTKLFNLKDKITLPEIRKEAKRRHEYMELFLKELNKEVEKKDFNGSVHKILNIIKKSVDLPDYNPSHPFKEDKTLIGLLVSESDDSFIKEFVEELKSEIL